MPSNQETPQHNPNIDTADLPASPKNPISDEPKHPFCSSDVCQELDNIQEVINKPSTLTKHVSHQISPGANQSIPIGSTRSTQDYPSGQNENSNEAKDDDDFSGSPNNASLSHEDHPSTAPDVYSALDQWLSGLPAEDPWSLYVCDAQYSNDRDDGIDMEEMEIMKRRVNLILERVVGLVKEKPGRRALRRVEKGARPRNTGAEN